MAIKIYRLAEEPTPEIIAEPFLEARKIPEVELPATVEWFRGFAPWYQLMDRSFQEARNKLIHIIKNELKVPFDESVLPCLVEYEEGKTGAEKQRIRRAHKTMGQAYSGLVDRMVKYRAESRDYAWDFFRDHLMRWSALWRPYECSTFRGEKGGRANPSKRHSKQG